MDKEKTVTANQAIGIASIVGISVLVFITIVYASYTFGKMDGVMLQKVFCDVKYKVNSEIILNHE